MSDLAIFKDSTILITGGAGFIGSDFVRMIDEEKLFKKVIILDSFTYAADLRRLETVSSDIEIIKADLTDTKKYSQLLSDCDFVVNMAAESHVDRSISDGFPFIQSNIIGSFSLFETCRQFPKISLIHVSTDEVYGSTYEGKFTELDNLSPSSVYSSSKASSDLLAMANIKTHKQRIVITRCTNNFGSYQNSEKLIPTIINNSLIGKSIPIYGDGTNQREWIFVSDHNSALLTIMKKYIPGNIYNIGSGFTISNIELTRTIVNLIGASEELITFVEDRKGHDFRYALDSSKLRDATGWCATEPFKTSLTKTIDWYKHWFETHGEVY